MTKAKFKKAMKEAMSKYGIDLHSANKMAVTNYPDKFDVINKAFIELQMEEMGLSV